MNQMEDLESKYKSIFDNTGTSTIIVDEDKTILESNAEFEKLSGYSKDEIEGQIKWTKFVEEKYLDKMKNYHKIRRVDPNSAPRNYEFKFKDKYNNKKDILLTVGMIAGTKHSIVSALDITDRKKAENLLSREMAINSDLANISHKLLESTPIEEISDLVLDYAKKLTSSKLGFVGYIDRKTGNLIAPTMADNNWTESNVKNESEIREKFGGLCGWVLNNKETILTNQPSDDYRFTGGANEPAHIETYLAVPAIANDALVGIISLANSDHYDKDDLDVVERLSSLFAIAIKRKHSEDDTIENKEKYFNIIEKFLKTSNEIFTEINKLD